MMAGGEEDEREGGGRDGLARPPSCVGEEGESCSGAGAVGGGEGIGERHDTLGELDGEECAMFIIADGEDRSAGALGTCVTDTVMAGCAAVASARVRGCGDTTRRALDGSDGGGESITSSMRTLDRMGGDAWSSNVYVASTPGRAQLFVDGPPK